MPTHCPASAELLLAVLATHRTPRDERNLSHARACDSCGPEVDHLRGIVVALRSNDHGQPASGSCLDDMDLARLADGVDPERDGREVAHLIACESCRDELVAIRGAMNEPTVAAELVRLTAQAPRRLVPRPKLAGGLIAAALAGLVLWPAVRSSGTEGRDERAALRERTITTTAAPRIVAPVAAATSADSLRWTSVPRADLYRVTVWSTDGTLVWQADVRDTVHALPREITGSVERLLLWEVQARTGWDRWVISDLAELTLTTSGVR